MKRDKDNEDFRLLKNLYDYRVEECIFFAKQPKYLKEIRTQSSSFVDVIHLQIDLAMF